MLLVLFCVMIMTTAVRVEGARCNAQRCVEIAAPAKINLFLEILGRRPDGFHELETLMVAVNWFDRLRFIRRNDDQLRLHLLNHRLELGAVPPDQRNLVIRALQQLRENCGQSCLPGCDVLLYKEIPSEAGLGGASSDAAAALLAGNLLWNLKLSMTRLHDLASQLGSDVPFFLYGGASVCRGRGEQIEPLRGHSNLPIVIVKPQAGLSTQEVFAHSRTGFTARGIDSLRQSFVSGCLVQIGAGLFNRLTEPAIELRPQIREVATQFSRSGAIGHRMSGSGSSYFGLFRTMRAARQAGQLLAMRLPQAVIHIGHTLGTTRPCLSIDSTGLGNKTAMEVQFGNH
jgi:4-diphosphocytidyl-2-C-methyl-D-erythritol kinase